MRILGSEKLPPGPVTIELLQAGQARERAISGDSSRRHCLLIWLVTILMISFGIFEWGCF